MGNPATLIPGAREATAPVPPLEPGDRLTRAEFERRYEAMPDGKKAELIEGVVHMSPAVRWDHHAGPHADLMGWLAVYRAGTPGVRVGDNGSIRLDLDNEPQPDATMIVLPAFGGRAVISGDDYIEGAPEFVAEISASTASIDLHAKLGVYRSNGVREYLVWRVRDREIDWFELREDRYEPLAPGPDGTLRSNVFPGLWLDVPAMLEADLARVLRFLEQGLSSPEHAKFMAVLKRGESGDIA
ncbi:MAG TPA: Uma2 family endonuclease [Tepidisphaeraceae bacterium]|nr:Uma2 family endonuclease [Tepidisphaeraceae bacterium]